MFVEMAVINLREKEIFAGHQKPALQAAFSPGGRWVVTASGDGAARLWCIFSNTQGLIN
jgi:WD40 repeat protein